MRRPLPRLAPEKIQGKRFPCRFPWRAHHSTMATLSHTQKVACPPMLAAIYLEQRLAPIADSGEPEILRLAVPIPGLKLEPSTEVAFTAAITKNGWSIGWSVPNSEAFPVFRGLLAIARENDHRCELVLSGSYEPPFGMAGAAFDAVVGSRMADATAQALLEELAATIERGYSNRVAKSKAASIAERRVSP